MSKNMPLAELLDLNIEINKYPKVYVQKVFVLSANFLYNKEFCDKNGLTSLYKEVPRLFSKTAKASYEYPYFHLYAWCKKEGELNYSFKQIHPTVKECEVLSPILRKVEYINSIIGSQRKFSINKYVDLFMNETQNFVDKLFLDVQKDCLNPWENFNKAKEVDKELKKLKKKEKDAKK